MKKYSLTFEHRVCDSVKRNYVKHVFYFEYRYWKCDIKGAPEGILKGKKIAIKDNTCVAGVHMCNGSSVMEGYIPDVDATVVSRILDAGNLNMRGISETVSIITHIILASHFWNKGKQSDPDKTPQNAASDQGLQCLLI